MYRSKSKKRLSHPKIERFLRQYLPVIRELYAPEQVWLFGSFAHGRPDPWSDVDLMIVSRRFARGKRLHRRSSFLDHTCIRRDEKFVVDPLCYTPQEFERGVEMPCITAEVVETGIRLI
jgi:predicted nucleotidyltransferase